MDLATAQTYDEWTKSPQMREYEEIAGEEHWLGVRTNYMGWYDSLKETLAVGQYFGEEEDEITVKYRVSASIFFSMKWHQEKQLSEGVAPQDIIKRRGTIRGRSESIATVHGCGILNDVVQEGKSRSTVRSIDQYGELNVQLLDARISIEKKECSYHRCILFYLNILQFCISLVVFAVGALELDGGQFEPFIATTVAGVVSVIGSVFGILGAIGENEGYLRKYLVSGFWLLSILTTFLYVEIYMLNNEHIKCNPSKSSFTSSSNEGCQENEARHASLIIIAFGQLLMVFFGAMTTVNLLDSINDQTALESKQLLLVYMRTRFFEAKQFMHENFAEVAISRRMELLDDDLDHMQLLSKN